VFQLPTTMCALASVSQPVLLRLGNQVMTMMTFLTVWGEPGVIHITIPQPGVEDVESVVRWYVFVHLPAEGGGGEMLLLHPPKTRGIEQNTPCQQALIISQHMTFENA
jgi:hypothetical protein